MTPALKLLGLRQPRRPTPTSRLERLSHRTGPQVSERPALSELRSVVHFRVLVAEMNAIQLTAEARGLVNDPARAPRLPLLQRMLESGRLQRYARHHWQDGRLISRCSPTRPGRPRCSRGSTGSSAHTRIAVRHSPLSTSLKPQRSRAADTRSSGGGHTTSGPQSGASFPRPNRLGPSSVPDPVDTPVQSVSIFPPHRASVWRCRSGVAQLVEQLAVNQRVTGSSPVAGVI